ncbi:MAG: hypothetical protein ACOC38_03500 [Promethearchaeia archaeon]
MWKNSLSPDVRTRDDVRNRNLGLGEEYHPDEHRESPANSGTEEDFGGDAVGEGKRRDFK